MDYNHYKESKPKDSSRDVQEELLEKGLSVWVGLMKKGTKATYSKAKGNVKGKGKNKKKKTDGDEDKEYDEDDNLWTLNQVAWILDLVEIRDTAIRGSLEIRTHKVSRSFKLLAGEWITVMLVTHKEMTVVRMGRARMLTLIKHIQTMAAQTMAAQTMEDTTMLIKDTQDLVQEYQSMETTGIGRELGNMEIFMDHRYIDRRDYSATREITNCCLELAFIY